MAVSVNWCRLSASAVPGVLFSLRQLCVFLGPDKSGASFLPFALRAPLLSVFHAVYLATLFRFTARFSHRATREPRSTQILIHHFDLFLKRKKKTLKFKPYIIYYYATNNFRENKNQIFFWSKCKFKEKWCWCIVI